LEKICVNIDTILQATFKTKGLKAYGLCELVDKDGKPNPITVDKKRIPAQIHDRFDGIFYHRILANNPYVEDEEHSFGATLKKKFTVRMRCVVAYKVKLGEEFMFEFANAFPDKLVVTYLPEYKFVHLGQGNLIADHEAVFIQEYGNNSYEKHRTSWNIFALEYDIEFILC
jgi:mannitol-1-phosphate/altronate dehydrogenase